MRSTVARSSAVRKSWSVASESRARLALLPTRLREQAHGQQDVAHAVHIEDRSNELRLLGDVLEHEDPVEDVDLGPAAPEVAVTFLESTHVRVRRVDAVGSHERAHSLQHLFVDRIRRRPVDEGDGRRPGDAAVGRGAQDLGENRLQRVVVAQILRAQESL
jgi:hypothetical protein